jgi:hypothetical protein
MISPVEETVVPRGQMISPVGETVVPDGYLPFSRRAGPSDGVPGDFRGARGEVGPAARRWIG